MADPFAILANSRLDVPQLLGAYQQGKQGRMQDMLFQRQLAREDRQEETDIKRQGVMARLFQPKGGGQSPQQPQAPQQPLSGPQVASGMGADMLNQAPQQLMQPNQLPPRSDGVTLNPQALAELYQIDPKGAMEIQTTFYNAEKGQIERAQQNGEVMYKVATQLQDIPAEQRQAVFQSMMPQLHALGLPDDQLQGADLSDQGLRNYAQLGNTLANISDAHKPTMFSPGQEEQDWQGNVTRQSTQPRIIMGADGVAYSLPAGGTQPMPQAQGQPAPVRNAAEYDALPPGTHYVDPGGVERIKGGASPQGSQTFPGK